MSIPISIRESSTAASLSEPESQALTQSSFSNTFSSSSETLVFTPSTTTAFPSLSFSPPTTPSSAVVSSASPPFTPQVSASTSAINPLSSSSSTLEGIFSSSVHSSSTTIEGVIPQTASVSQTSTSKPLTGKSHRSGVPSGATAGIAIATLIIGASIAFLAAWLLFARKRRRQEGLSTASYGPREKGPTATPLPIPASGGKKPNLDLADLSGSSDFLAGILPQTADDKTVKEKVSLLFDQLQLHVENFYRDGHVLLTPNMEAQLSRFDSGELPKPLVAMLNESSRPTTLIKHALIYYTLQLITPSTSADTSLLLPEFSSFPHWANGSTKMASDTTATYVLWRMLTYHLHATAPNPTQSRGSKPFSNIFSASHHFSTAFSPWSNTAYSDRKKEEHLSQVLGNVVELGTWLFGQAFLYEMTWNEGRERGGIVVAPALRKITDSEGRRIRMGQTMLREVMGEI